MIVITNIVGSGDLNAELDLEAVKSDITCLHTEYDPSKYHGLYVRLADDGPLVTVYRSGKYIVVGASSFEELEEANKQILDIFSELGIISETADTGFSVQNIVCAADLKENIDLNSLSIGLGLESIEYEPEQFPGLVYRPDEYSAVLLVFANGKIVITGTSDLETANEAFEHLQSKTDILLGN